MMLDPASPSAALQRDVIARRLAEIACEAGDILVGYHNNNCPYALKTDGSPASEADSRSESFIIETLAQDWPNIPIIAEETKYDALPASLFFLVDPLDGTRDFLAGKTDYSVNISLVSGNRPIASALAAPGLQRVWGAGATVFEASICEGRPVTSRPISVRKAPDTGLVALVSRLHSDSETDACHEYLPISERRAMSSALKFCLIAAGEADLYIRCVPTMEWDTAAGDHILSVAGGRTFIEDSEELTYGHWTRSYRNGPFVALGDLTYAKQLKQLPIMTNLMAFQAA